MFGLPLPRRCALVSMQAKPIGFGLSFLVEIVAAVPHERPSHPLRIIMAPLGLRLDKWSRSARSVGVLSQTVLP